MRKPLWWNADTRDLKSLEGDLVPVQVWLAVPVNKGDSRISYSMIKVTHAFLLYFILFK